MPGDLDRWQAAVDGWEQISFDLCDPVPDYEAKTKEYNKACEEAMPPLLEIARLAARIELEADEPAADDWLRLDALLRKHTKDE